MTVRYAALIVRRIFLHADTTTIRLILANGSLVWCVALLGDIHAFQRPVYAVMAVFASEPVWAAAFGLHLVGVYWRLFDPTPRPGWALFINGLGFVLWFISTAAINLAVGQFSQTSSLEVIMVCASGWALYRTGLRPEIVTP